MNAGQISSCMLQVVANSCIQSFKKIQIWSSKLTTFQQVDVFQLDDHRGLSTSHIHEYIFLRELPLPTPKEMLI